MLQGSNVSSLSCLACAVFTCSMCGPLITHPVDYGRKVLLTIEVDNKNYIKFKDKNLKHFRF